MDLDFFLDINNLICYGFFCILVSLMSFNIFILVWVLLICYGFCYFLGIFMVFDWILKWEVQTFKYIYIYIYKSKGFGMFTSSTHSSGDLCGGELRCVVWWRFGQAKHGSRRLRVVGRKLFFFFLLNSFTI